MDTHERTDKIIEAFKEILKQNPGPIKSMKLLGEIQNHIRIGAYYDNDENVTRAAYNIGMNRTTMIEFLTKVGEGRYAPEERRVRKEWRTRRKRNEALVGIERTCSQYGESLASESSGLRRLLTELLSRDPEGQEDKLGQHLRRFYETEAGETDSKV